MEEQQRSLAIKLFQAGVAAADPGFAVRRALEEHQLEKPSGGLVILAMGKAARAMAVSAMERLNPAQTLIVSHNPDAAQVPGARTIIGAHPLPDRNSELAAQSIEAVLATAGADDHVLALISGGASALVCAPVPGISLADKVEVNRILLGSGLDIGAMNLVRQNLSRLKGGGLAKQAAPARVSALILSDVIGNDLRLVASGPTSRPIGGRCEARAVLKESGVWEKLPDAVRKHLLQDDLAPMGDVQADNYLVGSNEQSVAAMAKLAPDAVHHADPLIGDVADAVRLVASQGPGIHLFGGETTVNLTGTGLGGRNQELALRMAIRANQDGWAKGWVFLSGGTDGRDGPTDAAGGLVDCGTLLRVQNAGLDPAQALANNDSYHALKAAGDLLMTGATGTNVADLQILIRP